MEGCRKILNVNERSERYDRLLNMGERRGYEIRAEGIEAESRQVRDIRIGVRCFLLACSSRRCSLARLRTVTREQVPLTRCASEAG